MRIIISSTNWPSSSTYVIRLKRKKMHTSVVYVVLVSVFQEFFSVVFHLIHYNEYSSDGRGVPNLDNAAIFFEMLSHVSDLILSRLKVISWGEGLIR